MIAKEAALTVMNQHLTENETIDSEIMTYYRAEGNLSGLAGNASGAFSSSKVPIRGLLAATNKRLLFCGEISRSLPVFIEIPYSTIQSIKEKKEPFALLKSIPVITVTHENQDTFSTQGSPEEFEKLKAFFKAVEDHYMAGTSH